MKSIGNKAIFARNLALYLTRSGKSQREMAEIVGVSSSTFNDWINGRKYPRIDKIEFLANYFGILKSDLIEDKNEVSPSEIVLTEGEEKLIELFRKVPDDKQQLVLQMIETALRNL